MYRIVNFFCAVDDADVGEDDDDVGLLVMMMMVMITWLFVFACFELVVGLMMMIIRCSFVHFSVNWSLFSVWPISLLAAPPLSAPLSPYLCPLYNFHFPISPLSDFFSLYIWYQGYQDGTSNCAWIIAFPSGLKESTASTWMPSSHSLFLSF